MKRWGWLLWLALVGCDDEKKREAQPEETTATATASADVATTGTSVAPPVEGACKAYLKALDACIEGLPEDQTADLRKMKKKQVDALDAASAPAKKQMQSGCQMALASLRQNDRCK